VPLVLATYLFAFQIYCDFSGYSDIAIGTARILGFDLMENFKTPYFSQSLKEFWSRWHISLSTWFRDYVFIPIGGSRAGKRAWVCNIAVVFLLSGLWHGANWTYIVWGAMHGVCYLSTYRYAVWAERVRGGVWRRVLQGINVLITFHVVVCAWVLFRANSIADAFYIARQFFSRWDIAGFVATIMKPTMAQKWLGLSKLDLSICAGAIVFLLAFELSSYYHKGKDGWPRILQWGWQLAVVLGIVFLGVCNSTVFIYFQF
jgi:D-alanyl-lipoteichoic acid acyltransferase DltB (MBOAT superfamily)